MPRKPVAIIKGVATVAVVTLLFAAHSAVSLTQVSVNNRTNRINGPIDERSMSPVRGHLHPRARAGFDEGRLDDRTPVRPMTMFFKRTAAQQAALIELLQEQQDPSSPNYHQWLTPEEFADRFGLSAPDLDAAVSWLQSEGFTIDETARS